MKNVNIPDLARELTDEQWRWVQDELAVEGCPLCGAEACLEACEKKADELEAYVQDLAAKTTAAEIRSGTLVDVELRPLGRAVLRVLGDDR